MIISEACHFSTHVYRTRHAVCLDGERTDNQFYHLYKWYGSTNYLWGPWRCKTGSGICLFFNYRQMKFGSVGLGYTNKNFKMGMGPGFGLRALGNGIFTLPFMTLICAWRCGKNVNLPSFHYEWITRSNSWIAKGSTTTFTVARMAALTRRLK